MSDFEVIRTIGEPALLEQLAEECGELTRAALKMARFERGENPTQEKSYKVQIKLFEGVANVLLCMDVLDAANVIDKKIAEEIEIPKIKDWARNIRETKPIERSYRKKPVVVKAVQTLKSVDIDTPEGVMHASPGDWIITGVNGEKYPCKPDIFAKTYDLVEEKQNE